MATRTIPDTSRRRPRPHRTRRALAATVLLALGAGGCATVVQGSWVRGNYLTADRLTVLRVAVVTAPLPDGRADLGKLWGVIATRWMNAHRDFIAKDPVAVAAMPAHPCHGDLDGILRLRPTMVRVGDLVTASVHATLMRCRDRQPIWSANAKGTWPVADPDVKDVSAIYAQQIGKAVEPYVAASFNLLRATLATLPHPKLVKDADVMEKIQLGS